jgi:hypothetical protein
MKAWEVLAITVDGELVCPDCAEGRDEHRAFVEAVDDMAPLFASDATGDETCGRCGQKISE